MSKRYLFTSESVTEGHPDKICDQISDTILDALLTQDPQSRVAAEVVVNTGLVLITGEISSQATVNYANLVRQKIQEIGYTDPTNNGFSADSCAVMVTLDEQSRDIAQGLTKPTKPALPPATKPSMRSARATRELCLALPATKPQNSCPCPAALPTALPDNWPRPAKPGCCPTYGPMAKPR